MAPFFCPRHAVTDQTPIPAWDPEEADKVRCRAKNGGLSAPMRTPDEV